MCIFLPVVVLVSPRRHKSGARHGGTPEERSAVFISTKVWISGATGLLGSHLIDRLLSDGGYEIFAFRRWRTRGYREGECTYLEGDLTDPHSVRQSILTAGPDLIFHFGAQSYPHPSFEAPFYTMAVNIGGTVALFEACRELPRRPHKIVVACSAAAYGAVSTFPTPEETPFAPLSPYGVSKAAQDLLGWQYFSNYGLPVVRGRSYIHVGPRQADKNAVQSFSKQVAAIETGLGDRTVRVGNLSGRRDILDARDAIAAYLTLGLNGTPGEVYNICSGEAKRIGDVLNMILAQARVPITVQVDTARLRPSDTPLEHGSYVKLNRDLGWEPQIPFQQTLHDILEHWRAEARS